MHTLVHKKVTVRRLCLCNIKENLGKILRVNSETTANVSRGLSMLGDTQLSVGEYVLISS